MRRMIRKTAALLLFVCAASFAQKWTPDTVVKVKPVAEVRVSPDGARVVYTVSEAVVGDDKSETVRQIWMAKSDGSDNAQLTYGDKSSNDPRWLPDSSGIVFTSRRSGKSQLYLLRLRGGEAEPLTSGKLEPGAFAVSPDGKSIAYVVSDMPPRWGTSTRIQLANLATGEKKDVVGTYDSQPDIAGFSADGARIFVREARGTVDRIYAIDVASNKVVDV